MGEEHTQGRKRTLLHGLSTAWGWLARRRGLSIALITALPLIGRLTLLGLQPIPVPATHDEFSYLLAADTFARGRLTNATPPLWQHFETFHELMRPTYMSVYPPGQGALLVLGEVLTGNPWWAVWFSVGVMCGTLTWMLQAWLPPRWALLGGFFAVWQFGFEHYWMNGYWGGSLAAIGGCLALGAWGHLRKGPRVTQALMLGLGMLIMAASRPFEGLVLSFVVLVAAAIWFRRQCRDERSVRMFIARTVLPALCVVAGGLVLLGVENRAVIGSAFQLPHQAYRHDVAVWPTFVFEHPRTNIAYRHEVLRNFFEVWEPNYEDAKDWGTVKGLIPGIEGRARMVGACYFPLAPYLPVALLSFVAVFFRKTRILGAAVCAAFAANGLANWLVPHYLAPVLGAMMAVHLQFLRFVRTRRWHGRAVGRYVFAGLMAFLAVLFGVRIVQRVQVRGEPWALARAQFQSRLESTPGRHLILVKYAPNHEVKDEWVFNGPDIPREKVIWARSMSPPLDRDLVDYYRGRSVWILDADASLPHLLLLATYPGVAYAALSVPKGRGTIPASRTNSNGKLQSIER